jgi:predicted acyltransferase
VTPATRKVAATSIPVSPPRLLFIDALRGFDMFWITGGDVLGRALAAWLGWTWLDYHLEHRPWEGFVFYDLIFPLFVFIVGIVLPMSLKKYAGSPSAAYPRIFRRFALLMLLGWIHGGLLNLDFAQMRWSGVLQRIAISYLFTALAVTHLKARGQAILAASILLGYWALLAFVPAPGFQAYDLSPEGNLAGYVDRLLLPGKFCCYPPYGDNEGLLSHIPAIATCLLGALTGWWLTQSRTSTRKLQGLIAAGVASLAVGLAWAPLFPIIKNLWTSSYVMIAAGLSLLLVALFYFVIDIRGSSRWAFFFVVIGVNALTIYVLQEFVNFPEISRYWLGGLAMLTGGAGPVVLALGGIAARWILLRYLYRNGTFLRV